VAEKSVSLNEAERRLELAEGKARQAERKQEEQVRAMSLPTTYEITLKNVSAPGLPRPMAAKPSAKASTASTPEAEAAPASDAFDQIAPGRSADDILLQETVKILADYVELLANPSKRMELAGPRPSAPAL
jgi:hypothetical protein